MSDAPIEAHPFVGASELAGRMRSVEWSETPFGRADTWPSSLRSALGICLGARFPIAIYWGPEHALLYNDAWSPLLGSKHPTALGRPGIEVWPELWDTIGPMLDQVMTTGEASFVEDSLLLVHRHGYPQECYFDSTFTAIWGDGGIEGIFNVVSETTSRVVAERRSRLLRELGDQLPLASTPEEACEIAARVLVRGGHDVPFCALYLVDDPSIAPRVVAVAGLAEDVARRILDLAPKRGRIEVLAELDRQFGALPGGPWPTPATSAIVAPLACAAGYLVIGASPRRSVDDDYVNFAERAAALVGNVIARDLAALDRAKTMFVSNVGHELRTPLTLMLGPTRDLLDGMHGELVPAQRAQLEMLHRTELRLQELVDALLDSSRLEAGRALASYEGGDVQPLTRDLAPVREAAEAERDRFRSLLGQVPALVNFLRGPDLVVEFAHPLTSIALGGRELIGKPLLDAIPELRDQEYPTLLRRVLANAERIEGREKLVRISDGIGGLRDTYWNFVYLPVFEAGGRVEGVMTFDLDVTEQVLARRRVEDSEEKFRRLVDQLEAGIAQTDLTGRFTLTNERYRAIVGRSEGELLELRMQDITHPDDLDENVAHFRRLGEHGTPFVIEKRYVRPDGTFVWVQNSVSRIDDRGGKPHGIAAVSVDITRRKFAEHALEESEERFRNMAEHAPVMVWVTEPDGRCSFLSTSWYQLTGQTPETGLGFGWLDAVHSDDREHVRRAFADAAQRGAAFRVEYRLRAATGEYRWAIDAATPRLGEDGRYLGYIGSVLDITDRRQAEAEAAVLSERMSTSQRAAQVGIYDWHLGEPRAYWSDELFALLGVSREDVTPTPEAWTQRIAEVDRDRGWHVFRQASEARRPYADWELRIQRPDGELRWIRMSNRIFYDDQGQPIRIVGAAIDIQELKENVLRERSQREQAENAVRFSEMFVGILGHDLRNPLSAIMTGAHLLEQRADTERIAKPVKRIILSADRMERMISQLLDFTRIRLGGGIPLDRAPMDLAALARSTTEELGAIYPRDIEVASLGDANGVWDRDRLAQLLGNLVANACQHGTPPTPVTIRIDGTGRDTVSIRVSNRGVIPPELLATLFEPLRSTEGIVKRGGSSGLGLGLFIAQQIAHAHGGVIDVASGESAGTSFTVSLPRATPMEDAEAATH